MEEEANTEETDTFNEKSKLPPIDFNQKSNKKSKRRMKNKGFGNFERRYSKLALNKSLIPERKRIDYVLIYPNVSSKDATDLEEKATLQKHEYNRRRFEALVKRDGFSVQKDIIGENVFFKLHCPFKRLCVEAEKVKIEMALKDCDIKPSKPGNCFHQFADNHLETDCDVVDYVSAPFQMNRIHLFDGWESPENFFRPALRSLLVHHILINMDIRTADEVEKDAGDVDSDEDEVAADGIFSCCQREAPDAVDKQTSRALKRKGLPYLLLRETYTDSFVMHDDSAKSREKEDSRSDHFLTTPGPQTALDEDPRRDLDEMWGQWTKFQPLWRIRNYFGEKITLYFAWTGLLITTLWIPMIFGIIVFIYGLHESFTASNPTTNATDQSAITDVLGDVKEAFDNDATPFFALFICCWGTVFLEMWKRQRATLAYEWDVDQYEANEPDRPQFYGTRVKEDPVTQVEQWFYPFKKQAMKYFTSASVLIFMVLMVVASVIGVIIYRVIMNVDYCPKLNDKECIVLTTVISSILNAVSILTLGRIYDILAVKLTDWENHRTQTRYDDSLIFKLFAFQFVNSYASCFYIAFMRGKGSLFRDRYVDDCEGSCMTQLSFQVLILMVAKPFPKFLKDIVLPIGVNIWRKRPSICRCLCFPCCKPRNQIGNVNHVSEADPENKAPPPHANHVGFLERERLKPDLGDFTLGEFTEKVILYGFLMLFASSFPLAPMLALIICYIDIRVDAKRMLWWYRRPVAFIAQDIGIWYGILNIVNFIGVITNGFIIAFTSNWGSKFSTEGKLWVVIGFEHIVFFLKMILAYFIPDVPQEVRLAIRREKYLVHKKFDEDGPKQKEVDFSELFPSTMMNSIAEETDDDIEVVPTSLNRRKAPGNDFRSQINADRMQTPDGLRSQKRSDESVFHVSYSTAKHDRNSYA